MNFTDNKNIHNYTPKQDTFVSNNTYTNPI